LAYNYTIAWGLATAAQEILDWVDGMIDAQKVLLAKSKGEIKDKYRI